MTDATTIESASAQVGSKTGRLRRRTTGVLLSGVGVCTIGYLAAITVTTLVAEQVTGSATWAGVPMSAAILGTATGAPLLSAAMGRWGRRPGLAANYGVGALGGVIAVVATLVSSLPLLVVGLFAIGLGNSGNALTRYLVADLQPSARRGRALSLSVWMGTIGAVVGPNMLGPAGRLAQAFGLPTLSGAYLVGGLLSSLVAAIYLVALRPDPIDLVYTEPVGLDSGAPSRGFAHLLGRSNVQVALAALVVGHAVMVLIMTMTPVHLRRAGHGLDQIGLVMSAHVFGMFFFSPFTGRLVDRLGSVPIILIGEVGLIAAAFLAATSKAANLGSMMFALFLLGLGWNFGFVAGSTLLTSDLSLQVRSRLQGYADATVWVSAALASFSSSLVLATFGYVGLCVAGAALVTLPLAVMGMHSRSRSSVG